MPSQTPMTGSNCDLGDAMIKTKTLRYNQKKARNFKNEFRAFLWLYRSVSVFIIALPKSQLLPVIGVCEGIS